MNKIQRALDRLKHDNYKRNNREQLRRKADDKAERYGGLLATIYDTIHAKVEDDSQKYVVGIDNEVLVDSKNPRIEVEIIEGSE